MGAGTYAVKPDPDAVPDDVWRDDPPPPPVDRPFEPDEPIFQRAAFEMGSGQR